MHSKEREHTHTRTHTQRERDTHAQREERTHKWADLGCARTPITTSVEGEQVELLNEVFLLVGRLLYLHSHPV